MKYTKTLILGKLLKRYKRFFADVEVNGEIVVAHVPNTGSMKSCSEPGSDCLISPSDNPERKLKFTLEMVRASSGAWVGVNTATPGFLIKELFASQQIDSWKHFDQIKAEVKINAETRLDFLFSNDKTKRYVEIKNVTLKHENLAMFPDAVTERGQKHLRELMNLIDEGHEAEIVYVIQRDDCHEFAPAHLIDPEYAKLLAEAHKKGMFITPLSFSLNEKEISYVKITPLILD